MKRHRRNLVLTAAICASLLMHGVVYDAIVVRQTQELAARIPQPPTDIRAILAARKAAVADPPVALRLPDLEVEDLFGEHGATGKGLNSAAGEVPMESRKGDQDQAALTPRPGAPAAGGDGGDGGARRREAARQEKTVAALTPKPVEQPPGAPLIPAPPPMPPETFHETLPPTVTGSAPRPTTRSVATTAESPATQPVTVKPTTKPVLALTPPTSAPVVNSATTQPVKLAAVTPSALPENVTHVAPQRPQPAQQSVASSNGGSPGHGKAGEAGHPSESESDEFSDHAPIVFHNGKVEAREGIKVKTVRPKLTEAGELALASMEEPVIIIKVKVDEQGNVTDADYLRRSNIPEVDLPHLRAAYDWGFSPTLDKKGNPRRDTHIIAFNWR